MGDPINHSVGLKMLVRLGDAVEKNQPIVTLYSDSPGQAASMIEAAIKIDAVGTDLPLIVDRIVAGDSASR